MDKQARVRERGSQSSSQKDLLKVKTTELNRMTVNDNYEDFYMYRRRVTNADAVKWVWEQRHQQQQQQQQMKYYKTAEVETNIYLFI